MDSVDWPIVMTCAVRPATGHGGTPAGNPRSRAVDYLRAIEFYLSTGRQVVVVENSGFPTRLFEELLGPDPNLAYVETTPDQGVNQPTKGYLEHALLEQATRPGSVLGQCSGFFKVTGRLIVRNTIDLVSSIEEAGPISACFDVREFAPFRRLPRTPQTDYVDTRFFAVEMATFRQAFSEIHRSVEPRNFNIERQYHETFRSLTPAPGTILMDRFPIEPIYTGRAGHWEKSYDSTAERMKRWSRGAARRLAPTLRF